jgi:hypothetical protein
MPTAAGVTAPAATTASESGCVLPAAVMTGVSYMALAISRLVRVEVVERRLAALRSWSCITMMGIVPVIDVAIKAAPAVEPRASSNEEPAREPVRTIIAVRCARVGRIVEVSVWAHGRDSNVHRYLSRCGWIAGEENSSGQRE